MYKPISAIERIQKLKNTVDNTKQKLKEYYASKNADAATGENTTSTVANNGVKTTAASSAEKTKEQSVTQTDGDTKDIFEKYYNSVNSGYGEGGIKNFDTKGKNEYELNRYQNDRDAYDVYDKIKNYYDTSVAQAAERNYKELYDAYVSNEMAKKYLPEQLARSGWETNLGATTSANLELMNNYLNRRAQSQRDYSDTLQSLYGDVQQQLKDTDAARRNANIEIDKQEMMSKKNNLEDKLIGAASEQYSAKEKADMINSADYLTDEEKDFYIRNLGLNVYTSGENEGQAYDPTPDFETQQKYGISDAYNAVDVTTAKIDSFGKHLGTGSNGKQDKYINKVLSLAQNGVLENGTVVNMNYGGGTAANYVYYNGKFYPSNETADITNSNVDEYQKNVGKDKNENTDGDWAEKLSKNSFYAPVVDKLKASAEGTPIYVERGVHVKLVKGKVYVTVQQGNNAFANWVELHI